MAMVVDGVSLNIEVTSSGTTYSLDGILKSCEVNVERNRPERAVLRVVRTTATVNFDPMDIVQIDTNLSGEVTYDTRFYGYVREVEMSDEDDMVNLICDGESAKLALSYIPYKEYGQSYVDKRRYSLTEFTASSLRKALYVQLSNTTGADEPILPMKEVAVATPLSWDGTHVPTYFGTSEARVFNKGTDNYSAVAGMITLPRGIAGPNPEIWVNARYIQEGIPAEAPTSTLVVEIYTYRSGQGGPDEALTLDNTVLAQGAVDITGLTTGLTWTAITLSLSDESFDIVSAARRINAVETRFFAVFRANTQHNAGWFGIQTRGFNLMIMDNATWENTTTTLSQAQWTNVVSGDTFSELDMVYVDDAAFRPLLEDSDYWVDTVTFRAYIWDSLSGAPADGRTRAYWSGIMAPRSDFYQLSPMRISYWKGGTDVSSTIEAFANDWILPHVDSLDIVISTSVDVAYTAFTFQNVSILDALNQLTEWSTITWRIYRNQAGNLIFEARSSRVPGDWSTEYTAAQQDDRSFYSGYDVTTGTTGDPSFVRLRSIRKRRVLGNKFGVTLSRNDVGLGMAAGSGIDSGFDNIVNLARTEGIHTPAAAQQIVSQQVEYIETVTAKVVGVDMSSAKTLLTNANELVYFTDSALAIDAAYVIKGISLKIDTSEGIGFDLVTEDVVSTRYKDAATEKQRRWGDITSGVGSIENGATGRGESNMGFGSWVGQYGAPIPPREEALYYEDTALTYVPGTNPIAYIRVGNGTPADPALGNEIARVICETVQEGLSSAYLVASIGERDFLQTGGSGVFDVDGEVTELGIMFAPDTTTAPTAAKSYSVGPTGTITWARPDIRRDGKITVIVKLELEI